MELLFEISKSYSKKNGVKGITRTLTLLLHRYYLGLKSRERNLKLDFVVVVKMTFYELLQSYMKRKKNGVFMQNILPSIKKKTESEHLHKLKYNRHVTVHQL